MPELRGIKISVISQRELKVHPEFPHAESSHTAYQNIEWKQSRSQSDEHRLFSSTENEDLRSQQDKQTSISVYIPSSPGSKFWIQWAIAEFAIEESQYYYFKLFMNGSHITSWGIDTYTTSSGQIMRGLFEPSNRWNYKSDGILYKNMGTEARFFLFAPENERRCAADDGGMFELRVFRALGRQRKLPKPTDFRNPESYGIIMPTGGLLDRPQDARFYDWHLRDPTDSPFAAFKYHYRTWDTLQSLCLIPDNHNRVLKSPTGSILSVLGFHNPLSFEITNKGEGDHDFCVDEQPDVVNYWKDDTEAAISQEQCATQDSGASEGSFDPLSTTIFDGNLDTIAERERRSSVGLQYDLAPVIPDPHKVDLISKFSVAAISGPKFRPVALQSKTKNNAICDRPLPDIPKRMSSKRSVHSRNSSAASGAPSITPSLRSYIDRGETSSPEAYVNTAEAIALPMGIRYDEAKPVNVFSLNQGVELKDGDIVPTSHIDETVPTYTISNLSGSRPVEAAETTPQADNSSVDYRPESLGYSPLTHFFNQPNTARITVRKQKISPKNLLTDHSISGLQLKNGLSFQATSFSTSTEFESNSQPAAFVQQSDAVSESEWMCRTPSPHKESTQVQNGNVWSPSKTDRLKRKPRRRAESSARIGTAANGSPMIAWSNAISGSKKVERRSSTSRERLFGWFENVRGSKNQDILDPSLIRDDVTGTKIGWI